LDRMGCGGHADTGVTAGAILVALQKPLVECGVA